MSDETEKTVIPVINNLMVLSPNVFLYTFLDFITVDNFDEIFNIQKVL